MKLTNRNSNNKSVCQSHKQLYNGTSELLTSEVVSIVALTQSWKCCSCKSENYNNKWKCSWCGHDRCGKCKELEG
ncbi:MAG: hypothetical protein IPG12_10675 [Saprospiraceae bacterium]|nr:hypothetical protein [Saprospiraceae bacterium]